MEAYPSDAKYFKGFWRDGTKTGFLRMVHLGLQDLHNSCEALHTEIILGRALG